MKLTAAEQAKLYHEDDNDEVIRLPIADADLPNAHLLRLFTAITDSTQADDSATEVSSDEVDQVLPEAARITIGMNKVLNALRQLGILAPRDFRGNANDPKRIPEVYLRASPQIRLDLLAGLMDSDGHLDVKGGTFVFSQAVRRFRQKQDV